MFKESADTGAMSADDLKLEYVKARRKKKLESMLSGSKIKAESAKEAAKATGETAKSGKSDKKVTTKKVKKKKLVQPKIGPGPKGEKMTPAEKKYMERYMDTRDKWEKAKGK